MRSRFNEAIEELLKEGKVTVILPDDGMEAYGDWTELAPNEDDPDADVSWKAFNKALKKYKLKFKDKNGDATITGDKDAIKAFLINQWYDGDEDMAADEGADEFPEILGESVFFSESKKYWKYFKVGDKDIQWEDNYDGEVMFIDKKNDVIQVYFEEADYDEDIDAEELYEANYA
jgi:hypothetical protein